MALVPSRLEDMAMSPSKGRTKKNQCLKYEFSQIHREFVFFGDGAFNGFSDDA